MSPRMKMYHELAEWWPLLSAPSDYDEEASSIREALTSLARRPVQSVLELGSGGGNNASHLKAHFAMTLCDLSHEMLAVSMALNPECEHVQGDMRSLRLGRTFDAVFVHDAIMYMTTETDLSAAIRTAAEHLAPGGAVVFVPDYTAETYEPRTSSGGHDGAGKSVRYLEWEQEPSGTAASVTFAILIKDGDAPAHAVLDEHEFGLFPRATWVRLIEEAGLEAFVLRDKPDLSLGEIIGGVRVS